MAVVAATWPYRGPVTEADGIKAPEPARYGVPGPPLSRQAPFYRGFFGALGVLGAVGVGYAVREAASVLTLVLISVFLAVGMNPLVDFGVRRGLRRAWAVLIIAVLFLGALTAFVIVVGGVLRTQVTSFIDNAPGLLEDLRRNRTIAHLDAKYHVIAALEKKIEDPDFATDTFSGVFQAGLAAINAVVGLVVVFVLTLYFLGNLPQLTRVAYSLTPASRRERVTKLGDEIIHRVGRFVIGSAVVAFLAGTVTLIFLFCVGLGEYALPLALLVALFDLVPLVGALIGAASVCVVGFATSSSIGIACVVFYLIYEGLEGYVIYPRVMRSSVDVPEYVTIVAVLVGGAVAGIVGALLALPIGAALLLLVREVWVRRQEVS
jgi:predicted PurR-regulated permease PerM